MLLARCRIEVVPRHMNRSTSFLIETAAMILACSEVLASGGDPVSALPEALAPATRITGMDLFSGPDPVTLDSGATVQTVVFRKIQWSLKNMPQSAALSMKLEREASQLPEEKRLELMNRTDDHIQLWLVNLKENPGADAAWKPGLKAGPMSHQYHRELAFLGKGQGYAWFGWMPIYDWIHLQSQLHLVDGDAPLAGAARGLAIEDQGSMTANSADALLSQAGAQALPHLKPLLASPATFQRALGVLSRISGPEATRLLLAYAGSTDPAVAARTRELLAYYPRPDAEDSYFKWLDEEAGRAPVLQLMSACAKVNKTRLAPLLPRILAAPKSVRELRQAFEFSRSLAGRDIPAELLKAEEAIKRHGYRNGSNFDQQKVDAAVTGLIKAPDVEAAACIGVSLAVATTKGDWGPANQAGLKILESLPDGRGRQMAKALFDSCDDTWVRQRLSGIVTR